MSRFEIYEGEISDTKTGLVWQKNYQHRLSWYHAMDYAESLGNGWRLPLIDELATLIDRTKHSPATDFPDMPTASFWSSSFYTGDINTVWYAHFNDGSITCSRREGFIRHIRCVRSESTKLIQQLGYNFSLTGRL